MYSKIVCLAICALPLVAGHCKITSATGDASNDKGTALGIQAGSGNSQADVTVFKGNAAFGDLVQVNIRDDESIMIILTCNPQAGAVDPAALLPGVNAIPKVTAGGTLTMTLHQINADGAGPMTCSVDPTSKGTAFQAMQITTNVPGNNGKSNAANADFPLVAQLPAGVACTGTVAGVSNLCMVKCANPAGPFGGVVPVQSGAGTGQTSGTGTTGGNDTISANTSASAAGSSSTTSTQSTQNQGNSGSAAQGTQGRRKGRKHRNGGKGRL